MHACRRVILGVARYSVKGINTRRQTGAQSFGMSLGAAATDVEIRFYDRSIGKLVQQGHMAAAVDAYHKLPPGVVPSSSMLVPLLRGLLDKGCVDDAFRLFRAMEFRGPKPTVNELNYFLKCMTRAPKHRRQSASTVDDSELIGAVDATRSDSQRTALILDYVERNAVRTDVKFWLLVASVYSYARQPAELLVLLQTMRKHAVAPDKKIGRLVLEALLAACDISVAEDVRCSSLRTVI
jgi:pentatricopeptide repeat protein